MITSISHPMFRLSSACALAAVFVGTAPRASAETAVPEFKLEPPTAVQSPAPADRPLLLADTSAPPVADNKSGSADAWQFRLGLPVWLPALSGHLTVKGHEVSPNQDTGDVVDAISNHLNFAGALHFEAEKDRLGLFVDTMYADLRAERDMSRGRTADASNKQFIGELGGFYTLVEPKPDQKGWGTFRADVLAGVRVTWLQVGLDIRPFNETVEHTIVDPIIGARMELGITDWLSYKLRGDVGGFGISEGTTSNFAWNIDTAAEFHLSKSMDLDLGYRWLSYDFRDGSGGDKFRFDATVSGPYLLLQLRL